MAIDYTAIPGLTEEQITALTSAHNTDVSNLIINRDNIKQEKLGVQEKLTAAEQVAEDARLLAATTKEELLKANGDMVGLKKHYEDELANTTAELTASAKSAKDALLSRDKGDVLNQVSSLIHDDFKDVSNAMLSNMLKVSYNDQGQPVTSFEHEGKVVANNVEEFKGWANEQDSFKRILKGVDSSGADTTQSRASGSMTSKPFSEMNKAEKLAYMETKANKT